MRTISRHTTALALLGACHCLLGCAGQGPTQQQTSRVRPQRDPAAVDAFVRRYQSRFPKHFRAALVSDEAIGAYAALHLSIAEPGEFHEAEVLSGVYGQETARARFVRLGGLTEAGTLLLGQLVDAPAHALDAKRYHVRELEQLINAQGELDSGISPVKPLTTIELQALRAALLTRTSLDLRGRKAHAVVSRLVTGPQSPLPRVARAFDAAKSALEQPLEMAAKIELLLADGLLRFARDMKRGNTAAAATHARWRVEDEQRAQRDQAKAQQDGAQPDTAAQDATQAAAAIEQPLVLRDAPAYVRQLLLQDLTGVRDSKTLTALLADLQPSHPQYKLLVSALARYRGYASNDGWAKVRRTRGLRPGRQHRAIKQLKQRLAREGFFEGRIDRRFDPALAQAIREYQRTHQLAQTGRPKGRSFWRSLNVSAARRVRSLALTLQRWRESPLGDDNYFVQINIPDYHLEMWKDGKRVARHKVVVGRARKRTCSERTHRQVLAYATPAQSARIETVVFAPHWNVTRDIKEQELDPKRGMDPLFYQKNGYELFGSGHGERVRELPGPGNALGFVKFLFPNRFNTYLHDTPLKHLFKQRIRAYSHGCMRLHQPVQLAELVLSNDEQWDDAYYTQLYRRWRRMSFRSLQSAWNPARYQKLRKKASGLQTTVALRQPLPIHIDYYTVRVDQQGKTHFLGDIYGWDRQRLNPRLARRCVPESVLAKRNFAQTLTRVAGLEEQAKGLQSCVESAGPLSEKLAEQGKRSLRLRRQLSKLEKLAEHHRNLSERIRQEHAGLAERLDTSKGRWRRRLISRALRVERLTKALDKMTRQAKSTCAKAEKAAAPPSVS